MKPSEDSSQPLWDTVWDAHLYFSGTLFILLVRKIPLKNCTKQLAVGGRGSLFRNKGFMIY